MRLVLTFLFAAVLSAPLLAQTQSFSTSSESPALMADVSADGSVPAAPTPQYAQSSLYPASADRKRHFSFEVGAGFNAPIGNDGPYITWGGNLTLGIGRQFTPHLGSLIEYQFIDDKLPGAFLSAEDTPGGNTRIWSFTLEPIYYVRPAGRPGWNAYVIGGGGFYRKVTNFNTSVPVVYCGYFGFCVGGYENATVESFASNQGGLNLGFGFTHSIGDSRAKYFAEARYLWVDSPSSNTTELGTGTTGLLPVTLGVRW